MMLQPMGADQTDSQPTENLEASVGTLLEDAYRTCERIENTLAEAQTSVPPPPGTLAGAVDKMVSEAEEQASKPAPPPPSATTDGIDPGMEVSGDLSDLDADLASLTDNLAAAAHTASAPPPQTKQSTSAPTPQLSTPTNAAPSSPAGSSPAPRPAAPAAAPSVSEPQDGGLPPAREAMTLVLSAASPVALRAMGVLSRPLMNKPRITRDTVGWLAVWTLFLSGALWVYVLFFHEPAGPVATAPAMEFVGPEGKHKAAAHESEAASHQEASATEHAKTADEPHETTADEHAPKSEHGGH